jgi:LTXXQ motif family protein
MRLKWRRSLTARELKLFGNRNLKGVYIMIPLTHRAARAATAAATLLGTVLLASSLFAASGGLFQAAAAKSPAAREILAQASPPEAMSVPPATSEEAATASSGRIEARIKELHKKLHITPAQGTQWDDLAQVMRDNAKAMVDLQKQRSAAAHAESMTAVDVVKSYASVIEAHEAGMKKFIPAFEALYNSMSDAQKKTADSLFRRRARAAAKEESKESKESK